MRVNLGCGQAYMEGWTNVDESRDVKADIYMEAAEFLRQYASEIDEIYMGHVLEHIMPGDALVTLRLMNERLRPGTMVSAVTPDMDAIFQAYLDGEISNDKVNASFIYSYVQPSPHIWCYGPESLAELFRRAGFKDVQPIDPSSWGPVFWKEGEESQWQCGVAAPASGVAGPEDAELPDEARLTFASTARSEKPGPPDVPTTEELLLNRVRHLREELLRENERRQAAEARVRELAPPAPAPQPAPAAPEPAAPARRPVAAVPGTPPGPLGPRQRARAAFDKAVPIGTPRREVAKAALLTAKEGRRVRGNLKKIWNIPGVIDPREPSYSSWCKRHDASKHGLELQAKLSRTATHQLSTQVIVLASGKVDAELVAQSYASVREQSWGHWELATASPSELVPGTTPDAPCWTGDGDITVAVNSLVENSQADFVLFLDAGDRLAPDCLYHVALSAHRDPLVDLVYWDDDILDGRDRRDPRFRGSWSPDMLTGADYVGHSFAIRRKRFLVNAGLRSGFGDAATWDLLLRSDLHAERVARVPRVLGHVHRRYDRPDGAGVRAVQEHLVRKEIAATAVAAGQAVRTVYEATLPKVTVVICTRHNRPMLSTCLPSLARTDYAGGFEVVIVDNGGQSADNEKWYADNSHGLDLRVEWWTEPFSYPAVNNLGASKGSGEVLVFLNDDTEVLDPSWLTEMVGWAVRPEIGVAGLQLTGPDGEIQHAGVVLGLGGFADHVFEGMKPGSPSHLGPTGWYRNVLSVTSACVAIRRELFDELGGFDERFLMCGSDVAIGIDAYIKGYRNVCSPYAGLRHLESATRDPSDIPAADFFASYWRYNPWLFGGDPYYSPNLSLSSRVPRLKGEHDKTIQEMISGPLGRTFKVFRQSTTETESTNLADMCRALPVDAKAVEALHAANAAPFEVKTVNWFFPDIDSPFYGGINTALRIADQLAREHGVINRFVVWGSGPDHFIRSGLAAAFPALKDVEIHFYDGSTGASLERVPECDVAIATLWVTAYGVAHFTGAKRKFYLIQDFEPMFYPAGTNYALAEQSYRLGLYGLCNTDRLLDLY
ncbi:MAG: glycosyltransferase, partial [Mycobacteriales bacterium]